LTNNFLDNPNVNLIAPSEWLADIAERVTNSKKQAYVLRNPIPRMEEIDREQAQKQFGVNSSKFVIGFVSVHLDNPLKGLKDLINALRILPLDLKKKIHLVLVGKAKTNIDINSISHSYVTLHPQDTKENPYSLMDLLVVPSRQDNSPNVIGEALMSGTRVLGSQVGGIPELLKDFDCVSIDTTDSRKLANQIQIEIDKSGYSREDLARNADRILGYKKIGNELSKIYQDVL
jgi:glycosyltransferase involved in cell wall biosynthesis